VGFLKGSTSVPPPLVFFRVFAYQQTWVPPPHKNGISPAPLLCPSSYHYCFFPSPFHKFEHCFGSLIDPLFPRAGCGRRPTFVLFVLLRRFGPCSLSRRVLVWPMRPVLSSRDKKKKKKTLAKVSGFGPPQNDHNSMIRTWRSLPDGASLPSPTAQGTTLSLPPHPTPFLTRPEFLLNSAEPLLPFGS